mmetsp:Transcript_97445/g.297758  ORF Transcript_97445/g.297758 Transcript_97445/m.297758 type:complete len:216 (+) Transcript_97445:1425-2072(+)
MVPVSAFLRGWCTRGMAQDLRACAMAFCSSTTFLPCIMLRMPMSSSRMSSVAWMFLAVCNSATIASFWTTRSKSFISFELSMFASSSSVSQTSALNLNTVEAICLTVINMRSSGRTASSVTTLESAKLLKIIKKMMNIMVTIPKPDFNWLVACILKATMMFGVYTRNDDAFLGGAPLEGTHEDRSAVSSHSKDSMPSTTAGLPVHAIQGQWSYLS